MAKKTVLRGASSATTRYSPQAVPSVRPPSAGNKVATIIGWLGACLALGALIVLISMQNKKKATLTAQLAIETQEMNQKVSDAVAASKQGSGAADALNAEIKDLDAQINETKKESNKLITTKRYMTSKGNSAEATLNDVKAQLAAAGHAVDGGDTKALRDELRALKDKRDAQEIALAEAVAKAEEREKADEIRRAKLAAQMARQEQKEEAESSKVVVVDARALEFAVTPIKKESGGRSSSYFDEREQRVRMAWTVRNRNLNDDYKDLKCVIIIYGENVTKRNNFKVIGREDITFDVDKLERVKKETKEFTWIYDNKDYYQFGYKYDGYFAILLDPAGNMLTFKSRKSTFDKFKDKVLKLNEGAYFDKNLEPANGSDYYRIF